MEPIELTEVIQKEREQLLERRRKLSLERGSKEQPLWFGIALSGGGIRSATINLGFLQTLNKYGILQKADYISSVSGGGYTHSYVQVTAKERGDFRQLFSTDDIDKMRQHGEYMVPRKGILGQNGNLVLLVIGYVTSLVMSWVSPLIVLSLLYYLYLVITGLLGLKPFAGLSVLNPFADLYWWLGSAVVLLGAHFLVNIALNFSLGVSKAFNRVESAAIGLSLIFYGLLHAQNFEGGAGVPEGQFWYYTAGAVILLLLGFVANSNALSFHRYYRKQLADLFLQFSEKHANLKVSKMFNAVSADKKDYIAPYPLINTCLNLLNPGKDEAFQGTKTSDYFLISPFYFGSKLLKYVPANRYSDYEEMTLPAAVTISAAAVNPGMGMYSNRLLSLMMTLFNFRLGFWVSNPKRVKGYRPVVWWPFYFFYELLGRIGSTNKMVNISDGGHIENLGVYELLRRGCRLIIAVDAGEDKLYTFADLNNLIIRARNELGLEIRFRPDEQPEELIRPRPSQVYSKKRFAIADIYKTWEEVPDPSHEDGKRILNYSKAEREQMGPVGTFVYVKSSVRAPEGKPDLDKRDHLKYGTYKYKIYHADFPHEPTSDQFFDEIQWEAYFQLGRFMGAEVLGVKDLGAAAEHPEVDDLLAWFDHGVNFFAKEEQAEYESVKTTPTAGAEPEMEEQAKYEM